MKIVTTSAAFCLITFSLFAAEEKPVTFVPAKPDPLVGDWQGNGSHYVAQIYFDEDGKYQANLLKEFDTESNVVAVLRGSSSDKNVAFAGDGWTATAGGNDFKGQKGGETFQLQHITS